MKNEWSGREHFQDWPEALASLRLRPKLFSKVGRLRLKLLTVSWTMTLWLLFVAVESNSGTWFPLAGLQIFAKDNDTHTVRFESPLIILVAAWSSGMRWVLFTTANFPDVMMQSYSETRASFFFFFMCSIAQPARKSVIDGDQCFSASVAWAATGTWWFAFFCCKTSSSLRSTMPTRWSQNFVTFGAGWTCNNGTCIDPISKWQPAGQSKMYSWSILGTRVTVAIIFW